MPYRIMRILFTNFRTPSLLVVRAVLREAGAIAGTPDGDRVIAAWLGYCKELIAPAAEAIVRYQETHVRDILALAEAATIFNPYLVRGYVAKLLCVYAACACACLYLRGCVRVRFLCV